MLNEIEAQRVKRTMNAFLEAHRPPPHIRAKLDWTYEISGQSVQLFEVRPSYQGDPGSMIRTPVFKTTFVKRGNYWKLFWMRSDLKWHAYEPFSVAESLDEILRVVRADSYGCFFG